MTSPTILPQIKHIVVVMLENRSFDNLCGWLYSESKPNLFIPETDTDNYDGLDKTFWNPSNSNYFSGAEPDKVYVKRGTDNCTTPNPDPEETFDNVTEQLGIPFGNQFANQGFLVNYEKTMSGNPDQIMQTYSPEQLPVLSALARHYAISDAWFCSVPSQTWANRSFVHAGTSNGNVNNGEIPDPLKWDVETIFNVLENMNIDWKVYNDTVLIPSLTRTMFPKLWHLSLESHFEGFSAFKEACANGSLPPYSFVEPSFLLEPNDQHPPHDVLAGEKFLHEIYQAVSTSPAWNETLLVITYDEHGGCYDHVLPPTGATIPDKASNPGEKGFTFDRFGVRVPTILVSPYIQAGTVFRSTSSVPYDHTSILATLRDWLEIPENLMLPSKRIAAAPTFESVLTLDEPRTDIPDILPSSVSVTPTSMDSSINGLQKSLIAGVAKKHGLNPIENLTQISTRQHAVDFFNKVNSR